MAKSVRAHSAHDDAAHPDRPRAARLSSVRASKVSKRGSGSRSGKRGDARGPERARDGVDTPRSRDAFYFYVEGPQDRAILRSWARRVSRPLERAIDAAAVILGGRQPARALEHFRRETSSSPGARGLCVLDRDDGAEGAEAFATEPGLEFFTWPRRHIESYLVVPAAIRRSLDGDVDAAHLDRLLEEHVPAASSCLEASRDAKCISLWEETDVKRLLGPQGPVARGLGRSVSVTGIARAMRSEEIHPEVHALFDRVRERAGLVDGGPTVVVRKRS